jgi:hypothetical protein
LREQAQAAAEIKRAAELARWQQGDNVVVFASLITVAE